MDQKPVTNVILTGVGGQGSILASHLLAEAALKDGHDVKLGPSPAIPKDQSANTTKSIDGHSYCHLFPPLKIMINPMCFS